eukprot:711243_1
MADSVRIAITECNYNHIDCASIYNSQYEIGHVLLDCFNSNIIERDSLHITSKIWNNEHKPAHVHASVEKTLKDLNIDYLDLCLIPWPFRNHHVAGAHTDDRDCNAQPFDIEQYIETWQTLNDLVDNGLIKNIGVSNMTVHKLQAMKDIIESTTQLREPAVNQVEMHPYLQQPQLVKYCEANDIVVTAALPLGSPERP